MYGQRQRGTPSAIENLVNVHMQPCQNVGQLSYPNFDIPDAWLLCLEFERFGVSNAQPPGVC